MTHLIVFKNRVTKIFCFFIFGLFSIIVSYIIFPFLSLIFFYKDKGISVKRDMIKYLFRFFLITARIASFNMSMGDYKKYTNLKSTIVVSNHPSLLDIVLIMAAIPRSDCIVNQKLYDNFFIKNIVRDLYINSGAPVKDVIEKTKKSLDIGNNVIIFPEGTRTKSENIKNIKIKKGAAQLAIRAEKNILPIHIKTINYIGLAKNDSILNVHKKGTVFYNLIYKDIIDIRNYLKYNLDEIRSKQEICSKSVQHSLYALDAVYESKNALHEHSAEHTSFTLYDMVRLLTEDIKNKIFGEI